MNLNKIPQPYFRRPRGKGRGELVVSFSNINANRIEMTYEKISRNLFNFFHFFSFHIIYPNLFYINPFYSFSI